mgnify:CR=1 FL=1
MANLKTMNKRIAQCIIALSDLATIVTTVQN